MLHAEGATKEWFPETHGPCSRELRINDHLGAGGVMTPGKIQDPEGAKIVVISLKTTAGVVAAIHKHAYKIVCFGDSVSGILHVDTTATAGGKHDPSKHGRSSILIYKSYMYSKASVDPERYIFKIDQKARNQWVSILARQI